MAKYGFEKQDNSMPRKSPNNTATSTKKIPVESGEIVFHIGRKTHNEVKEKSKNSSKKTKHKTISKQHQWHVIKSKSKIHFINLLADLRKHLNNFIGKKEKKNHSQKQKTKHNSSLTTRIWNGLEFVAVTAVIFTILFFALNFDSYSRLFISKLDQLRGTVSQNPYTAQQIEKIQRASPEGQQPLPIVKNSQAAKKQIPAFTMEIAPPDDRIIIPRIGQNVPIVRVPTDKLLKRDWAALENQIQDALRHGVVHFPGTALPGDKGNVVITGHSSYFPWDSGRFKDVFALLHQVGIGDRVVIYRDQIPYEYKVYDKQVVMPDQVEILTQKGSDRLTLITCTPVGTNLKRLIILAAPEQ